MVLAVIVKLAGDPIFAKFRQDVIEHILDTPEVYIWSRVGMWRGCVGIGGNGLGWGGLRVGADGCWE